MYKNVFLVSITKSLNENLSEIIFFFRFEKGL